MDWSAIRNLCCYAVHAWLLHVGGAHASAVEFVWKSLGHLPEPIGGAACVSTGNRIVLAGGTNWPEGKKTWSRAVRAFDCVSLKWSVLGNLPAPCGYAVSGVRNGILILSGGSDGVTSNRSLWRFPAAGESSPASVIPHVYSSGGILGDELIIAGGTPDANDLSSFSKASVAIHLETLEQRTLAPPPGPPVGIAASAVCSERLFVFGGARWDAAQKTVVNVSTTHVFSTRPDAWLAAASYPFEARGLCSVALGGRYIYVGGGFRTSPEGFTNEAFIYDTHLDHFRSAPGLPLAGMTSLVKEGNFVYCLGGEDRKQHRSDGFWRVSVDDLLKSPSAP
jgi:hypothetical protein